MWCFANALADTKTLNLILPNRTQSPPTTLKIILNISLQSNLFTLHLPNNVKSNKRQ